MITKICCRCNLVRPLIEFHNKTSSKDGLDNRCKDCKRKYNREWSSENRDHVREYNKAFVRAKRQDPRIRMYKNLLSRSSKFKKKKGLFILKKFKDILGCSKEGLFEHIESQFDQNMNWENYAEYWEVDHEIELFRCRDRQDYELINHFTNLRPLEKNRNRMRNYE